MNSVEIRATGNDVTIAAIANSVALSVFDVYTTGFISAMGHDPALPFASLPVSVVGGAATKYYADYYSQNAGQRVVLVGGRWTNDAVPGPSCWSLDNASSSAFVSIGGRLVRKAV